MIIWWDIFQLYARREGIPQRDYLLENPKHDLSGFEEGVPMKIDRAKTACQQILVEAGARVEEIDEKGQK